MKTPNFYIFFITSFVLLVITMSGISFLGYRSSVQSTINRQLEKNLATLKQHPIQTKISEYDQKYGTSISLYGNNEKYSVTYNSKVPSEDYQKYSSCLAQDSCSTEDYIQLTNNQLKPDNESWWSLESFMKYGIYPLIVGVIALVTGNYISKRLKIIS